MMSITTKRLVKLLEEKFGTPFQVDSCTTGGSVPACELHEIYSRRKETAEDKYTGFDEVLGSLEGQGSVKVKVHDIEHDGKSYIVFTDKKAGTLLGILVEG